MVTLGVLLGIVGQFARLVAELADPQSQLNARALGITVLTATVIGAAAGGIGAVTIIGDELDQQDLIGLIAVGYIGTDFVTQFLKRKFESLSRGPRSQR
jgi:hypothetical protein